MREMKPVAFSMALPVSLMVLIAALPLASLPAHGQTTANSNLQSLISGKPFPLTLTMKDLNGGWRRISVQGEPSNYLQMMTGGGGSNTNYYTLGETVTTGSETFVVAYQAPHKPVDFMAMMRGQMTTTPPDKLTPDTTLTLTLLNLRTMGSISDVRAFDMAAEVAARDAEIAMAAIPIETRVNSDESVSNLKQVSLGLLQYVQDHDGKLPDLKSAASVKKALEPYVKNETIMLDPRTHESYYANPALSGVKLADIANPADIAVFYEGEANDGKRAVAFMDGHVKRVSDADEWPKIKQVSHIP